MPYQIQFSIDVQSQWRGPTVGKIVMTTLVQHDRDSFDTKYEKTLLEKEFASLSEGEVAVEMHKQLAEVLQGLLASALPSRL